MIPTLEDDFGPGGGLVGVGVGLALVGEVPGVLKVDISFGEPAPVELSGSGLGESPGVVDWLLPPRPPSVDTLLLVLVRIGLDDVRGTELELGEVVGLERGLSG